MLPELLALFAAPFLVIGGVIAGIAEGGTRIVNQLHRRRAGRLRAERTAVERELDRTQDELRRTILGLAEQLGANAHDARKALIRESFIASGKIPENH